MKIREVKLQSLQTVVTVVLCAVFPVLFLLFQNEDEIGFSDIKNCFGLYVILSVIVWLFTSLAIKKYYISAVIASTIVLAITNYAFIESLMRKIFPFLYYWHIMPIYVTAIGHMCFWQYKKISDEVAKSVLTIMNIVFGGLILFNFVFALPVIVEKQMITKKHYVEEVIREVNDLPNIYYILADEYSGFDTIKKYYSYDNIEFYDWLQEHHFMVSTNSYNESIDTVTITTNNLNLDYVVTDDMIQIERESYGSDPALFVMLNQKGYRINNLSEYVEWQGIAGKTSETDENSNTDFAKILWEQSIFYPFIGSDDEVASRKKTLGLLNVLQNTYEGESGGVFTYGHLDIPHAPFVFDRNGEMPNFAGLHDWKNKEYYLGQYIFTTGELKKIVSKIIKNDPDSIIILQSDHGARWTENEDGLQIVENKDARNILNAVYFRGTMLKEIEGQSAVNTLIIIYNKLFDEKLPLREVPES